MLVLACITFVNILFYFAFHKFNTRKSQSEGYKDIAIVLFVIGYLGFLPGVIIGFMRGYPISTLAIGPHENINSLLYIHIFSALVWVPLCAHQFLVGNRGKLHRIVGYIAALIWNIPMGFNITFIWSGDFTNITHVEDFFVTLLAMFTSVFHLYTIIMYFGVTINMALGVAAARRKDLVNHKDYMIVTLLWTADPGLNRVVIHLTHLFGIMCWTCVSMVEVTQQRIIVNYILVWVILFASKMVGRSSIQLRVAAAMQCVSGNLAFIVSIISIEKSIVTILFSSIFLCINLMIFYWSWFRHPNHEGKPLLSQE